METHVRVRGCCERDIDLLLLEEFVSSPDFCRWFTRSAGFAEASGGKVRSAERSATASTGESDLEVMLECRDGSCYAILIENKVAAGLRPRQAERYRERGESYVRRGSCRGFRTVLVAPKRYLGEAGSTRGFDACVSYEAVKDALSSSGLAPSRLAYKQYMLSGAIERAARGWQLIEDEPVTRFWRRYWELACVTAPELELPEPSGKPSGSGFVRFAPVELPADICLQHKVPYGHVDLQFAGMGTRLGEMRERYKSHLREPMHLVKAGKSAAIRIKVPPINMADDLKQVEGRVMEGIWAAKFLLQWYASLPEGAAR